MQLGLKRIESFANGSDILDIVDVTPFVREQAPIANSKKMEGLLVTSERVYVPAAEEAVEAVGLAKVAEEIDYVEEDEIQNHETTGK